MSPTDNACVLETPVGRLRAVFSGAALCRLTWTRAPVSAPQSTAARDLVEQLHTYFAGELRQFQIETAPEGTPFQQAVWTYMCTIPYGETRTYGQCAATVGGVARAVGTACGDNPIPIVIPCHRILAADGLGGYSGRGGSATKTALLRLEGVRLPAEQLDLPLG